MNFDSSSMYNSSQPEERQLPPRYFWKQHPPNHTGNRHPFSVHGGSNNFGDHNMSFNRRISTTTNTNYNNEYDPMATFRRNAGWNKSNHYNSIRESSPSPQPATSHYCHLSYYGEEVDKEYLPHHYPHHSTPPNENITNFQPFTEFPNFSGASLRKSTNKNTSPLQFKRSNEHRFYDDSEQETKKFAKPYKRWGRHPRNDDFKPDDDSTHSFDSSVLEGVRNFKTAASSFQRQASHNEDLSFALASDNTQFQEGWSGVTSTHTRRKVVIKDDGHQSAQFPKPQKSFQRHLDLKSGRYSANNMSLDEIIKGNHGMKRKHSYAGQQVSEHPRQSIGMLKPTWLSGDGKNFTTGSPTLHPQKKRRQYPYRSSEGYYEFDGERTGEDNLSQNSTFSMQGRHHKRQKIEGTFSKRRNFVKTEKRPVVIDGSNVAFAYGEDLHFECKGIHACVQYFLEKGCDDISVIVPRDHLKIGASKDVEILQELKRNNMLILNWNGQFASGCDDRFFILDVALDKGAIIVSNLNFTDVARSYPKMRHNIWNRVVDFQFSSDSPKEILFPNIDPSGRCGLTWDDVLYD